MVNERSSFCLKVGGPIGLELWEVALCGNCILQRLSGLFLLRALVEGHRIRWFEVARQRTSLY